MDQYFQNGGAAPIQRSIMNLENETGISIMKIEEELDCGPVSNIYKIKIDNNQNAQEISEKLSLLAAEKILDNVDDILEDKAKFIQQDHSKATYAKKIDKNEGQINWNEEAKIIRKNKWFISRTQELFLVSMGKDIKY